MTTAPERPLADADDEMLITEFDFKGNKFTVDDLTDKAKELCGIVANGEKIVADLNIELLLLQAGLKPAVDGLEETLINEHEPLPESP